MIDGDYVKLNTSINTASNSKNLIRDADGNIDAEIELRLPDNLFGSVNQEIEKVTMQTSKMRLSMEETPIAQIPLDRAISIPSAKVSTCKLDVYPFVLLDNDEYAPTSLSSSALPYYKSHFVEFRITASSQPTDAFYVVRGDADDDDDYFGLTDDDTNPFTTFIRQVIDVENLVSQVKHPMNMMVSSAHETYVEDAASLYINNYASLEQMFQDSFENAITYASTECLYVFYIHVVDVDAPDLNPPQHRDITLDVEIARVERHFCYWKMSNSTDSGIVTHLSSAVKPRIHFGADTFQISYDTVPFKEIVPILWNTPYVQTYDYPEQMKVGLLSDKPDWFQPPPKRMYKYGVSSSETGYGFTLLDELKARVLNLIGNEATYRTFSFLPWKRIPDVPRVSDTKKLYKLRSISYQNHSRRKTQFGYAITNNPTVVLIRTYTSSSATTPVYHFQVSMGQVTDPITPSNWDTVFKPDNRVAQSCTFNTTGSITNTSFSVLAQDASVLLSQVYIYSTQEVKYYPGQYLTTDNVLSGYYYTDSLPTGDLVTGSDILFDGLSEEKNDSTLLYSNALQFSALMPTLYPDVASPSNISNTSNLKDYVLGIPPRGAWAGTPDSGNTRTHFIPPGTPTSVEANWQNGVYDVTVTFPALASNRWATCYGADASGLTIEVSDMKIVDSDYTLQTGVRYSQINSSLPITKTNMGNTDTCYLLDGTTCDVTVEATTPIRYDQVSDKKYQKVEKTYTATKKILQTGILYSNSENSTANYYLEHAGTSKAYSIPAYSPHPPMYCIRIVETDSSEAGEEPWTRITAKWQDKIDYQSTVSTVSTGGLPEEDTIRETSSPVYSDVTVTSTVKTYENELPTGRLPNVPFKIPETVTSSTTGSWEETGTPTRMTTGDIQFNVFVDGEFKYVPGVSYVPTSWSANNFPYRPNVDPIVISTGDNERALVWQIDPMADPKYMWKRHPITTSNPTWIHTMQRYVTQTVTYRVIEYVTVDDNAEETAVSTTYEGNVRLTFTWNNIPTVVLSPIQSIVLVLQGMQVQSEIQPINIAQAGSSSLTTSVPIIENFYSLAASLRDLHDELVITKENYENTPTYTLSTRSGYDRSFKISAKYIAKDGSLHQIKIPPNGVFNLQLIFKVSFYSSSPSHIKG